MNLLVASTIFLLLGFAFAQGPGALVRPLGPPDVVSGGLTRPFGSPDEVSGGLTRPGGPPDEVHGGLTRPFGPPDGVTRGLTRGGPPDFSVKVPGLTRGRRWGSSLRKRGPPSPLHAFPSCQQMDMAIRDTHEGS